MRLEADDAQRRAQPFCCVTCAGDDGLMPAMHAVKGADGDRRALQRVRHLAPVAPNTRNLHQRWDGLRRRGTRTTATPSMIMVSPTKPSQLSLTRALSGSTSITVIRMRTTSSIRTG